MVHGPIDDNSASLVVSQLLFLESENPVQPIHMYIMSPGGQITSGMAIYDTMQYISCPVHTLGMGMAASMVIIYIYIYIIFLPLYIQLLNAYAQGSFLLAGGEPGQRRALPNAEIMVHQPRGGTCLLIYIYIYICNIYMYMNEDCVSVLFCTISEGSAYYTFGY